MEKLKELRAKKEKNLVEMQGLLDASQDGILSEEAQKKFDALKVENETINKNIANIEDVLQAKAEEQRQPATPPTAVVTQPAAKSALLHVPAEARKWSSQLRAFKGADAVENAYKSGMWFAAAFGNETAKRWCADHGVAIQAVHQGGVNTTGGYLVPEVLSTAIIELVLQYGSFRANAGIVPMTSDTIHIPRRTGGLTAYFVGEGDAATESTKSWDNVKLVVKDLAVITRISNQLASDAIISVMDNLTNEIALTFATTEDNCGWLGDGTSTYGGISGVEKRLVSVACTGGVATGAVTAGAGLFRYDTGYAWANVALADLVGAMALLPSYARINAKWYTSPAFYYGAMMPALAAAGGVTMAELVNGPSGMKFLGYPVILCESIYGTAAINRIYAYFGDLTQAAKFGDRQQMAIASSDSASVGGQSVFERNQIALRGVERFDINVHDVGTSSTRGPIVGLLSHSA